MNKKEISEIKKQLKIENVCISKIAGCYVTADKQILTKISKTFLMLPEEEQFKYLELFKRCLSGRLGKSLVNLEYRTSTDNEKQAQMLQLVKSELGEKEVNVLYESIIDSYNATENYYISIAYGSYDTPQKAADGTRLEDGDTVYNHVIVAICPVKKTKPGLIYDSSRQDIINAGLNMMVSKPDHGFLYPSFAGRNTNIHEALYFSKKPDSLSEGLISEVLGCEFPDNVEIQKEAFATALKEGLAEECTFRTVKTVCEKIRDLNERSVDPYIIDSSNIAGLVQGKMAAAVKDNFDSKVYAENIVSGKSMVIENSYISVKINNEYSSDVNVKTNATGEQELVIRLSEPVTINGLPTVSAQNKGED